VTKVNLSCASCYGAFTVSKCFFKKEDDHPRFCTFCGKESLVVKGEWEVPRVEVDKEALVRKLIVDVVMGAGRVNDYAQEQDIGRNHTNYGCVSKSANILNYLDVDVDVACWRDGDYLKIKRVTIDGNVTEYHNGQVNS
jgi:hypothetical protein